jgi:hypothetical protein
MHPRRCLLPLSPHSSVSKRDSNGRGRSSSRDLGTEMACSGHGVLLPSNDCFCDLGYTGKGCESLEPLGKFQFFFKFHCRSRLGNATTFSSEHFSRKRVFNAEKSVPLRGMSLSTYFRHQSYSCRLYRHLHRALRASWLRLDPCHSLPVPCRRHEPGWTTSHGCILWTRVHSL